MKKTLYSRLSDDLYHFIFTYLEYNERVSFVCVNKTFQLTFLKAVRQLQIQPWSPVFKGMLKDIAVREKLLSMIQDPYKQLDCFMTHVAEGDALSLAALHSIRLLRGNTAVFMKQARHLFHRIRGIFFNINCSIERNEDVKAALQYLAVSNSSNSNSNSNSSNFMRKKKEEEGGGKESEEDGLGLRDLRLNFENSPNSSFAGLDVLPYIPGLTSIQVQGMVGLVIPPQYAGLHRLELADCDTLTDVSAFGSISELTIINCRQVTDIRALQNNHTVKIEYCPGITDYSNSFQNSVSVSIRLRSALTSQVNTGLHIRFLTVDGFSLSSILLRLPASLRYYKVGHVQGPLPGFLEFENLRQLCLSDCPDISSVAAYGRIPILELISLRNLSSLEGLGRRNRSVTIRDCPRIADFSPLRYVNKLEISNCIGFRNATEVDHVYNLTLTYTLHTPFPLQDLSPLGAHVHRLRLAFLFRKFPSLKGLENVPIMDAAEFCVSSKEDNFTVLHELESGNHQKIIFHISKPRLEKYCPSPEMKDIYHQYYSQSKASLTFLRKA